MNSMATVSPNTVAKKPAPPPPPKFSLKIDFPGIRKSVLQLLRQGLNPYELKLNSKLIAEIHADFEEWLETERREINSQLAKIPSHAKRKWLEERFELDDRRRSENRPLRLLTDFLFQYLLLKIKKLDSLKSGNLKFRVAFSKVRDLASREKLILNYAAELGATPAQLRKDARAFSRWFDEEAVIDRYAKRVGQIELVLIFGFSRLSEVIGHVFRLAHKYHFESSPRDEPASSELLRGKLAAIWQRLNIEGKIQDALVYDGDDRVHVAVLNCLARAIGQLPDGLGAELLDPRTLVFIHRAAMENKSNVWIQCSALSVLCALSFGKALPFLKHRLANPQDGDDMFVRRHALQLIERRLRSSLEHAGTRGFELVPTEAEPSPFVRQKIAQVAFLSTHENARKQWKELLLDDPVEQVRAAALLAGIEVPTDSSLTLQYLEVVEQCLSNETSTFVLRTALHCLTNLLRQTTRNETATATENRPGNVVYQNPQTPGSTDAWQKIHAFYRQRITPRIANLQSNHAEIPLRRWAAQANEQIWAELDEQARRLLDELRPRLQKTLPGRSCRIAKQVFRGIPSDKLGRIFAVLAQDDFGYDIHKGWLSYRIQRGPSRGFRLWRMIHEFKHASTDKRQALRHTVGRISTAKLRAPSQILGELSETKVPGEPLTISEDGTWRPFLPLPDDFVSILNMSWCFPRTVRFYTSEGQTVVTGPRGLYKCLRAAWNLNLRFEKFAVQRNWNDDTFPASKYINSMRSLGFDIKFLGYEGQVEAAGGEPPAEEAGDGTQDASVTRFFLSALIGLPLLATVESAYWQQLQRFTDYFGSPFENSLEQLVVFAGIVMLLVLGKHLYANWTLHHARKNIPISIGGWGTRGKSGTERLKAALVGMLGHGLVSKTTGCEAMFIHANPLGEPLEIPLFRPYDKATIWEQRNLVRLAARMEPSVFLWECMALNPGYVDVLQRQWTRDDLATITNAYPDHEDIQGPAGYNVAETIAGFVPQNSHLISTEQVMRPYITESCKKANSTFRGVGWLESGLITNDVLERFPYKEHPDNIALVAALGDEMGCSYEYCLKAMADYLVPDLGVLKTHPVAEVRGRRIEFTNGMSANERFGCMGNWRRLGFDQQDAWDDPATWICGVVNNRADRVPRSKVFAKIIVEDIQADRFFLIGSNLQGLRGFIREAWDDLASTFTLRDKTQKWSADFALETLKQSAREFRQPAEPAHVQARLEHMAKGLQQTLVEESLLDPPTVASNWNEPAQVAQQLTAAGVKQEFVESVLKHQREWISALEEYQVVEKLIKEESPARADAIEQKFISTLKTWYFRKIVVIEDFDATGEEVVATIVNETPPGFLNRCMGLQNIKGTGLDFVYRFQAWDVCHQACCAAMGNQVQKVEKGLQVLVSMPVIGQLCESKIKEVIRFAKSNAVYRRPELQTLIEQLEKKLESGSGKSEVSESEVRSPADNSRKLMSDLQDWMIECAEQFLDVHDSIRRRDTADLIYQDLASERISRQRAILELRELNKRQKGGWLAASFRK